MGKWKLLFWLVALFVAIGFISLPAKDNIDIWDFVGLIVSALSLIPLYGFSYSVPIGNKPFAIGVFALNAVKVSLTTFFMGYMMAVDFQLLGASLGLIYIGVLFIWLYPQFMYAFKSNEIWK